MLSPEVILTEQASPHGAPYSHTLFYAKNHITPLSLQQYSETNSMAISILQKQKCTLLKDEVTLEKKSQVNSEWRLTEVSSLHEKKKRRGKVAMKTIHVSSKNPRSKSSEKMAARQPHLQSVVPSHPESRGFHSSTLPHPSPCRHWMLKLQKILTLYIHYQLPIHINV